MHAHNSLLRKIRNYATLFRCGIREIKMKNTGKSKIWKNVLVASSTFVVGAAAAIGITYAVVHKDPIADKLLISGSNTIQTFVNYNGEEDYQATDKISGEFVKGQ
jgi:hypothetical protein